MATCGHCKATGVTVAHVRGCGQGAVATLPSPDPQPGNVVTLRNADGYWSVLRLSTADQKTFVVEEILAGDKRGAWAYAGASDVEILFPDMQTAADYRIELDQRAERARVRGVLHGPRTTGDSGYYASNYEARGELPADVPAKAFRQDEVALAPRGSEWAVVDELRNAIKPHLLRKVRNATMGHFATRVATDGNYVTKFYRVKALTNGRVYVDAQASDALYPVRRPDTLTEVLTAILADPQGAAEMYGMELGQCYRCNRTLTDETSRALGIGPECRSK